MNKLNWLFLMLFSVTLFSCSDDDDEGVLDSNAPTVAISQPTEGQSFLLNGDEALVVDIDFQVEDDLGLEEAILWVTSPGGQKSEVESWDVSDFLHDDTDFEKTYALTINSPEEGTYVINVEARDDQGNKGEDEVSVTVAPIDEESSIVVNGIEEGSSYTIGAENEVAYVVKDEQGVDSVAFALIRMDEEGAEADTLVTQGYGEDYFTDNITDDTDFTIEDQFAIPNTSSEGEFSVVVITFRDGEEVNTSSTDINAQPNPDARLVNINLTPPEGFDTNADVFLSGDFQTTGEYTDDFDQAYRMDYDEETGLYSTSLYVDPDHDFTYRYGTINAAGESSLETDETCMEAGEDVYNRSYMYADGDTDGDGNDEINDTTVSFLGYGDC